MVPCHTHHTTANMAAAPKRLEQNWGELNAASKKCGSLSDESFASMIHLIRSNLIVIAVIYLVTLLSQMTAINLLVREGDPVSPGTARIRVSVTPGQRGGHPLRGSAARRYGPPPL